MADKFQSNVTILNWNANSITNKKTEFIHFLHHYEVDIACITETHLSNCNKLFIPNYKIYRSDRTNSKGGGVLIAINSIHTHHQEILPDTPGLETIAVSITINNNSLKVIAAYKPPTFKLINTNLQNLFNPNDKVLLLGDLNSKHVNWGCQCNNQDGKILAQLVNNTNIKILSPSEPTYYPMTVCVNQTFSTLA